MKKKTKKKGIGAVAVIAVIALVVVGGLLYYFKEFRYDKISECSQYEDHLEHEVLIKGTFYWIELEDLGGAHVISELTPFAVQTEGGAVYCHGLDLGLPTAIYDLENGDVVVIKGWIDRVASVDDISGYKIVGPVAITHCIVVVAEIHKAELWE